MIFAVIMLWFFLEPQQGIGITVSPDLGKRNATSYRDYLLQYNNSNNLNISLIDRNRRLVPYMTFYLPDELPVSQYYTIDMPEQQSYDNHQQYQPQQKQPVHNKPMTPIVRLNPSPFRPENKVPGPFIPIVYPDTEVNNEKIKLNPTEEHNDEIPSGYYLQQKFVENDEKSQRLVPVHSQQVEASTPKPLYPLLNEVNLEPVQQHIQPKPQQQINRVPSYEEHRQLTPEEKYVIYLEEQLVQKQQQHQQKHQKHQKFQPQSYAPHPLISKPPPIIVLSSTAAPLPDNQILQQEQEERVNYKQLVPVYQQHQNEYSHAQAYPQSENQQNFIEYVEPEQQHQIVEIPTNSRATTASPVVMSSPAPIYANAVPGIQSFKPIASVKSPSVTNQHFYKQEKRPVYVTKLITTPQQTVRQHLTETTHVPSSATLTTYHPTLTTAKPTYTLYRSSEKPLKLKPSQRYKPIVVAQPVPPVMAKPIREQTPSNIVHNEEKPLPDFKSSSLADILRKLQESNHLPQTLTPDNIDNSIRTLIKILNNLKQSQTIVENPPQHHDEDYEYDDTPSHLLQEPGPNSGRPGIDYPALAEIPQTSFNCKEQRYKGFFGDPETHCQVWHYCDLNGGQASFLCPNGTIFSQVALTCDWWFNVKCSSTAQLYVLNERLYKYILPFTPKFPEDYSGPLVDKYLALKFKEMEEKMRKEKMKGKENSKESKEQDEEETDSEENDNIKHSIKTSDKDESNKSLPSPSSSESKENDDDIEENRGSIDTGIPISSTTISSTEIPIPITSLKPIIVTSTGIPFSSPESNIIPTSSTTPKVKVRTSVESEKLEVIEIKTDGTSGHLIPPA